SIANSDLGMIRAKQGKADEAMRYLEAGVKTDQRSALPLFEYAHLLSLGSVGADGLAKDNSAAAITRMRDLLRRAIAAQPMFTESYDLLAFVALAANDQLDEAASAMQTALTIEPGRNDYALRLADV